MKWINPYPKTCFYKHYNLVNLQWFNFLIEKDKIIFCGSHFFLIKISKPTYFISIEK